MNKTICELFEEQVEKSPGAIAVTFEGNQLTYGMLNRKANQLARLLREDGVRSDCLVAIMVERSVEMILCMLSILKAGGAYLPIAHDCPKEKMKFLLEDSGVKILLTQKHLMDSIPLIPGLIVIDMEDRHIYRGSNSNLININKFDDLAYIIYTSSGTIGRPKGVMVENKSVVNFVDHLAKKIYNKYEIKLNIALVAPYTSHLSVKQIFSAILLGHTLFIVPGDAELKGNELLRYLHSNSIDVTDGTSEHISTLWDSMKSSGRIPNVRHLLTEGDGFEGSDMPFVINECYAVTRVYTVGET